jgi:hypothetical protein
VDDKLALILAYGCEDLTAIIGPAVRGFAFTAAYEEACRRDEQAAESLRSDFG